MTRVIAVTILLGMSSVVLAQADGGQRAASSSGVSLQDTLTVGQVMQNNGGSLYRAGLSLRSESARPTPPPGVGLMFVPAPEPKLLKKHDLITIIIREESSLTSDATTDLKKDSNFNAKLEEFIKLSLKNMEITGGAQGPTPPSVKWGLSRDFKGEAKLDRTDKFTTRIAAEVVDVKPNGTIAIQARKSERHDEEEQELILSGICRGTDVTPDNSIYSWQIYNLQITKMTNGSVTDTAKRGFVPKVLDVINPF